MLANPRQRPQARAAAAAGALAVQVARRARAALLASRAAARRFFGAGPARYPSTQTYGSSQRSRGSSFSRAALPRASGSFLLKGVAGGLTSSACAIVHKASPQVKTIKQAGTPQIRVDQYAEEIQVASGFQASVSFSHLNTSELYDLSQLIQRPVILGSGAFTGVYGPQRFVVDSLDSELTMTNMSTAACEVTIWDVVPKRDIQNNNHITCLNKSSSDLEYVVNSDPESYWNAGLLMAENSPDGTTPSPKDIVGSSPYDSPLFKEYFKVVKQTRILLPQGASHRHLVKNAPNKLIDNALYGGGATTYGLGGATGITSYSMVQVRGLPVTDATPDQRGLPTTAPVKLACVQARRYKVTVVQQANSMFNYVDNLTTPVTTGVINIGSGQPEDVTFAPGS